LSISLNGHLLYLDGRLALEGLVVLGFEEGRGGVCLLSALVPSFIVFLLQN